MPSPAALGRILVLLGFASLGQAQQLPIRRVELLPDRPSPYHLRDWRRTTRAFDRLVFDADASGMYLPLIWRVPNVPNLDVPGFGLPSYVGKEEMRGKPAEAIAALGALLGATAIGIDKRAWVELTPQYLNPAEGTIVNNVGGRSGSSFWYELFPSLTFTQLSSRYPDWERGRRISKGIADAWIGGIDALEGNFDHTSYDFQTRKPFDNGNWKEPEAAAAVAYLELFEGLRSGDSKYVTAARRALDALRRRDTNPTYEILLPYGALAGAYLNAERGDRWDVPRFVDWCLNPDSPSRLGWGMVAGKWGGYDVGGLVGSTTDGGGYAFAMNSFATAAALAPVARYDDRYSAALAKWVLNLANASRLFYRDALPKHLQSSADWPGDRENGIAYEGLRKSWEGKSPYATGDAKRNGWAKEDLGIYGGGYVGLLAALVHPTDVPMILRIDLRATDFLPARGYPTDLLWNPYETAKTVRLNVGPKPVRLYDAVGNRFLQARPVRGAVTLRLAAKQSIQVVQVPPTGKPVTVKNRTLVGGIPIDYNNGRVSLPPRVDRLPLDHSVAIRVPKVSPRGAPMWDRSEAIALQGGTGSTLRAGLRFAWNESHLFFRIDQQTPGTETTEAPSAAELRKHWWDFEAITLSFDFGRQRFATASIPEIVLGWSSTGTRDLAFSFDMERIETRTSGSSQGANRVIEGKIRWADLHRAIGVRKPLSTLVRPGAKIGCQPLTIDGTFRRQAYIGGAQYVRPSGYDANSRTLVLAGS
ncbi:MAG: hypothetical protein ACO1SV_15865 [Fimbriimonas sp.]